MAGLEAVVMAKVGLVVMMAVALEAAGCLCRLVCLLLCCRQLLGLVGRSGSN